MGMNETRVGLCVSGGIAAYKAVEVLRLLQKAGCDVRVAMTNHATEFIAPLTFRALSGHAVIIDDYDSENPDPIAHVNFSQEIDLLLIVPATANILAKFANGIADDFISTTYLASNAPILVAPAMNVTMWRHPATARNIEKLRADGVSFVEPVSGELACKTVGTGKLEDVENIAKQALAIIEANSRQDLNGEKILLTIGGTREALDPVRFISNASSGKMGFALAQAARNRGAKVVAIVGSTNVDPPAGIEIVGALSAKEMFDAVNDRISDITAFIGTAAVADYRPKHSADTKIKKDGNESLTIELEKTDDILAMVSSKRHKGLIVVGFAAETNRVKEYAKKKLEKKDLDILVANDITKIGAGFNSDTNVATIFSRVGNSETDLPLMSKIDLAEKILDELVNTRKANS